MAWDSKNARRQPNSNAARPQGAQSRVAPQHVEPKSAHVADPALQPFLDPSFDAADYFNATLPPLQNSSISHSGKNSVPLAELSTQTQTLLSQLSAHTTRLTATLTQLTDEILRSGSRLAYEVEVLRGETLGLSEALTEGLQEDVVNFVPGGLGEQLTRKHSRTETFGSRRRSSTVATPKTPVREEIHPVEMEEPQYIGQLRTLTLVKSRLDEVIKTFGDAMEWTFPPSEVSVTSSFLSVSAPEPGSDMHSTEEKGQQVSKKLREEIADLLIGDDPVSGIEAAAKRVEELKNLATVWKGTAEEKARIKFVESLAKMVEDRHRDLLREVEYEGRLNQNKPGSLHESMELPGDGKTQSSYGFISQLQKLRLMAVIIYIHTRNTGRLLPPALLRVSAPNSHPCWLVLIVQVGSYIPNSIINVLNPHLRLDALDLEDELSGKNPSTNIIRDPKFHLLLPNQARSGGQLCKTILTAAILNYPPPTLITSGNENGRDVPNGNELVKNVFKFLIGKEVRDDDLVLIMEEDTLFQLHAEVTLSRFLRSIRDSNALLRQIYGTYSPFNLHDSAGPKFTQKVLFGAQKKCAPNSDHDPACFSVPESPLPAAIYGTRTDKKNGKYTRPRYMHATVAMGKVKDLRPIYKAACEILEFSSNGQSGAQYVFAQLFGEQEYHRSEYLKKIGRTRFEWLDWLSEKLGIKSIVQHDPAFVLKNSTEAEKSYEFGIGLDYGCSIFQVMDNFEEDIRFITFDHPTTIASSLKNAKAQLHHPNRLPPDLHVAKAPFGLRQLTGPLTQQNPPIVSDLDTIPYKTQWTDLFLATNMVLPGGTVPTTLNFQGIEELMDGLWDKMWFHNASRALLRQAHRSPIGEITSEAADGVSKHRWDLRGDKGGMWTDRGEWLEWTDVCGNAHEAVFGDGRGEYGKETLKKRDQPAYSKAGILPPGKLLYGQDDLQAGQVRLDQSESQLIHPL
ncbi:hypothetical protein BP6252_10556 [Coleophoma cylindrospora]|uniref:Uncharacterized protein n=1 Tax=Coleophoma cylindrospora TaxID=1849047 RepID=A0A3D8QSZ1_9HELO|nr:hypothetical protein BP6252_10556 [Coleophoma cylindrospora]